MKGLRNCYIVRVKFNDPKRLPQDMIEDSGPFADRKNAEACTIAFAARADVSRAEVWRVDGRGEMVPDAN